MKDSWE